MGLSDPGRIPERACHLDNPSGVEEGGWRNTRNHSTPGSWRTAPRFGMAPARGAGGFGWKRRHPARPVETPKVSDRDRRASGGPPRWLGDGVGRCRSIRGPAASACAGAGQKSQGKLSNRYRGGSIIVGGGIGSWPRRGRRKAGGGAQRNPGHPPEIGAEPRRGEGRHRSRWRGGIRAAFSRPCRGAVTLWGPVPGVPFAALGSPPATFGHIPPGRRSPPVSTPDQAVLLGISRSQHLRLRW